MKKISAAFLGFVTTILVTFLVFPPLMAHSALGAANALMGLGMSAELAKYVTSSLVNVDSSGNLVLPAATNETIIFTVGGTERATLSAAGALSTDAGITAATGDVTSTAGSFIASAGGQTLQLQEGTAASACMGTLTCSGASDVVTSTTCAKTASRIFLTRTSLDADTTGDFYIKSISNGVSFTIACETNDTGTLNWLIINESA